ncbi:hypothetical protein NA57DRAFT_75660 [Rhizodiscina lignyota]|uniref:Uncharacterized protein n=1 Tax=Rhizodiscina lignyota TaxID=1504668 RepID=A0A9P4IIY6_9PEZI|nr:hypothetical protein NA57DRAFT_75660 [Rhizodiscina lignyota]
MALPAALRNIEWLRVGSIYLPAFVIAVLYAFALGACTKSGLDNIYIFSATDAEGSSWSYRILLAHFGVCLQSKAEDTNICGSMSHVNASSSDQGQQWVTGALEFASVIQKHSAWSNFFLATGIIFIAISLVITPVLLNVGIPYARSISLTAFSLVAIMAFTSAISTLELVETLIALNNSGHSQLFVWRGIGILAVQWIFVAADIYLAIMLDLIFRRGGQDADGDNDGSIAHRPG